MQNVPAPATVPRLAATVMLVRSGDARTLEVYLTRRHARSRFMPDAFVFPGGAVDPADAEIGRLRLRGPHGAASPALIVAAVRETFEEAGILLADREGEPARIGAQDLARLRRSLALGTTFGDLLAAERLTIDAQRLVYYSNWITPASEPIRFDAHFFLAVAPPDQIAVADHTEVYDGVWLSPSDALARSARGEIVVRFPTRKHLERLAAFDDVDAALEAGRARRVAPVEPTGSGDGDFSFDHVDW